MPGALAAHRGPGRQLPGHRDRCPRRYPNRMTEPAKTPPAGLPEAGSDLPGTGRTEAFSDGVFAIVITLLVLDLTNPHYRPGGLGAALARQWPSYLAFGFSFVYVGVIWLNHHALFRRISRLDLGLNWINLGVLLTIFNSGGYQVWPSCGW